MKGASQIEDFYTAKRFNDARLHAAIVKRIVMGNVVIDQEKVSDCDLRGARGEDREGEPHPWEEESGSTEIDCWTRRWSPTESRLSSGDQHPLLVDGG
jgi:hypothetical protein